MTNCRRCKTPGGRGGFYKGQSYCRGYYSDLYRERQERGECSCGESLQAGFSTCQACRLRSGELVKARKRAAKLEAFRLKGGRCEDCGWDEEILDAYDLHHTDPDRKEINFARDLAIIKKRGRVLVELDQAVLLCARCHRVRHYWMKVENDVSRGAG